MGAYKANRNASVLAGERDSRKNPESKGKKKKKRRTKTQTEKRTRTIRTGCSKGKGGDAHPVCRKEVQFFDRRGKENGPMTRVQLKKMKRGGPIIFR